MILSEGNFNGHQIVPRSFVADIRKNASVERLQKSPLTGDLFPDGVGYRSFFYVDTDGKNAIAAAGAFGQFCYISPDHDTVIVLLSSGEGWQSRLDAGMTFEQVEKEDIQLEEMRWQVCRDLCEQVGRSGK